MASLGVGVIQVSLFIDFFLKNTIDLQNDMLEPFHHIHYDNVYYNYCYLTVKQCLSNSQKGKQ